MSENKEFTRNRPADKGRRNDPDLRDEDARQGASTMSSSETDDAKNHLTRTISDDEHRASDSDEKADKRFDE